jgi:hypothetical protein
MATSYLTSLPNSNQIVEVAIADDRTVTVSWDTAQWDGYSVVEDSAPGRSGRRDVRLQGPVGIPQVWFMDPAEMGTVVHHSRTYRPTETGDRGALFAENAVYILPDGTRREGRTVWVRDGGEDAAGPLALMDDLSERPARFLRMQNDTL